MVMHVGRRRSGGPVNKEGVGYGGRVWVWGGGGGSERGWKGGGV